MENLYQYHVGKKIIRFSDFIRLILLYLSNVWNINLICITMKLFGTEFIVFNSGVCIE
jgi:hypothetical protein